MFADVVGLQRRRRAEFVSESVFRVFVGVDVWLSGCWVFLAAGQPVYVTSHWRIKAVGSPSTGEEANKLTTVLCAMRLRLARVTREDRYGEVEHANTA